MEMLRSAGGGGFAEMILGRNSVAFTSKYLHLLIPNLMLTVCQTPITHQSHRSKFLRFAMPRPHQPARASYRHLHPSSPHLPSAARLPHTTPTMQQPPKQQGSRPSRHPLLLPMALSDNSHSKSKSRYTVQCKAPLIAPTVCTFHCLRHPRWGLRLLRPLSSNLRPKLIGPNTLGSTLP